MNPLKSKHYPRIMYLAITIVSLLIFFSLLSLEDGIVKNIEKKSLTGFAISQNQNNINNNSNLSKTIPPSNENLQGQVYSAKSYMIFYIALVAIIVCIFFVFLSLRSSVLKNIEKEEKENEF